MIRGVAIVGLLGCGGGVSDETTVAAAASLRRVMPDLVAAYRSTHPDARITVTYGASGSLRRQVEAGAPIDLVVFAGREPVEGLVADGLVAAETVRGVASNALVLVAPAGTAVGWTFETLHLAPEDARIAIGDPGAVPAGRYAVDALTALGTWDRVLPRTVFGGDVAGVLAHARRGEVDAAVVYATDVVGLGDVRVLDRATGSWAPRPEVVAGRTVEGAADPHAAPFLAFLGAPEAGSVWRAAGFGPARP